MGATSSQVVHPDKPTCEGNMHMKKTIGNRSSYQ